MTALTLYLATPALGALAAIGAPAHQQSATTEATESYIHCQTGLFFPAEASGLIRASVRARDANGCFDTIKYIAPGLRGDLRISIIPGGDEPCSERFAKDDERMRARWRGLLPRPTGKPLRLLGSYAQQHTVRYTDPEAIGGRHQKPETVLTLWVGCIGPGKGEKATWLVRYESDFEAADEAKVVDLPEKLFAAIDWRPLTGV
jgi:hypothetical protein